MMEDSPRHQILSPLPPFFLSALFLTAVLNGKQFLTNYQVATEENPDSVQSRHLALEEKYAENFLGKTNFLDGNGAFSLVIQNKYLNEALRLKNGHLVLLFDEVDTTPYVEEAEKFYQNLQEIGLPFAYIQAPGKLPADDHQVVPTGFQTYYNSNSDQFLQGLDSAHIPYLDLRETIQEQGLDHFSLFPVTDAHWTAEGAFWAYVEIARYLEELLGYSFLTEEYLSLDAFHVETYHNKWIGTTGQRTGIYFGGMDDFSIITPKFETNYHALVPEREWDIYGSFQDACLDMAFFHWGGNDDQYSVYNYHEEYVKFTNFNAENDLVLFLLRDSFAGPVASFLSLHFKEVHLFDSRHGAEAGDVLKKIKEVDADVLLQLQTIGLNDPLFFLY
ncbi:MAG: hypothetical protein R3Y63_11615 [Eubacteriales bacterium]